LIDYDDDTQDRRMNANERWAVTTAKKSRYTSFFRSLFFKSMNLEIGCSRAWSKRTEPNRISVVPSS
jgi:hypothetical protein